MTSADGVLALAHCHPQAIMQWVQVNQLWVSHNHIPSLPGVAEKDQVAAASVAVPLHLTPCLRHGLRPFVQRQGTSLPRSGVLEWLRACM